METNHITYNYIKSFERIESIIDASDNSFEEVKVIPSRDKLTFTNGFYVWCTAIFVDIRDSSSLPSTHNRPKLAKLYRAYVSEVVAIMNGDTNCAEINVVGDGVSGIFNTPYVANINTVFGTAAQISSLIDVLNCKFRKKGIKEIKVGIGISYGKALMIKAGYKGSMINEVVWMGDVVNEASKLAGYGDGSYYDKRTMVSSAFYQNLNDHNKSLLQLNINKQCYHGYVVNSVMDEWHDENCK